MARRIDELYYEIGLRDQQLEQDIKKSGRRAQAAHDGGGKGVAP